MKPCKVKKISSFDAFLWETCFYIYFEYITENLICFNL